MVIIESLTIQPIILEITVLGRQQNLLNFRHQMSIPQTEKKYLCSYQGFEQQEIQLQ